MMTPMAISPGEIPEWSVWTRRTSRPKECSEVVPRDSGWVFGMYWENRTPRREWR